MQSANAYTAITGKPAHPASSYDLFCVFDEARENENAYHKQLYFDESGDLREILIRYPNDRISIRENMDLTNLVDATDWYFSARSAPINQIVEEGVNSTLNVSDE